MRRWSEVTGDALALLVDDVHLADAELDRFLVRLCDGWPRPHRLVLAGRRLPPQLRRTLGDPDRVLIDAELLRFRPEETRALLDPAIAGLLDDPEVALVTRGCDGWAAAIALATDRLRRVGPDPAALARQAVALAEAGSTVPDLLQRLLADSPPVVRSAIEQLAWVPRFDDELAQAAGLPGGLAELVGLGLPLDDVGDGLVSFPGVVREALAATVPDQLLLEAAARHLLGLQLPGAALEVLTSAGLEEPLARLLVDLPPELLADLDVRELAAAIDRLAPELVRAHPSILIHLADLFTVVGEVQASIATIARAETLLAERGGDAHDPEVLEVRSAVLAREVVARGDDGMVGELEALLAEPALPLLAQARLRAALGRAVASRRTAPALRAGARHLDQAAQLYHRAGSPGHAAAMRTIAANVALLPLGRAGEAVDHLDEALATVRGNVLLRLAILPYRALALVELGRYAEAEGDLTELRRAALLGGASNDRAAAVGRWAAARMASQRGDADATWAACRAVERAEVPVDPVGGALFRADAAQLLARVGWYDEAERLLAEAQERLPAGSPVAAMATFAVAAARGDRPRAELALAELDGGRLVEPRDRWRVSLLHAQLCHVDGDPLAPALAAAAFEEAAQLGHAELPLLHEPRLAGELLPLAAEVTDSAGDLVGAQGARVRVLGRCEVEVAGERHEPVGRPAELLAYLALNDRQAGADELAEVLWPDAEPGRGRERLRTVLRRIRRDLGELVERHGEAVRLRAEVTVDVDDLLAYAARAAGRDREAAAKAALAVYDGPPVPSLSHLDWVDAAGRVLEERVLAMHDVVADAAEADGRLDEALRAVLDALVLDPLAESRVLTAARLLAEQGRRTRALRLLDESREALTDAGLTPGPELTRLEAYLRRAPAVAG